MRFGQSPLWKTSESGNGVFYHFSGTAVYRTKFDVTNDALRARVLSVGGRLFGISFCIMNKNESFYLHFNCIVFF